MQAPGLCRTFTPRTTTLNPEIAKAVQDVFDFSRVHVLLRWEEVFHVPDFSYIMDSQNLNWLCVPDLYSFIGQGAVVSRSLTPLS